MFGGPYSKQHFGVVVAVEDQQPRADLLVPEPLKHKVGQVARLCLLPAGDLCVARELAVRVDEGLVGARVDPEDPELGAVGARPGGVLSRDLGFP